MSNWLLAMRLARRELRAGLGGFRIFIACLALGVGAIAAIGSFASAVEEGLREDARILLGGDIELRLTNRAATATQRNYLATQGRLSESVEMRAMARPAGGEPRPVLVQMKSVDDSYPLYGGIELAGGMALDKALARRDGVYGAAIDEIALNRLGLKIGERIRVGNATFEIRALIAREPDRGFNAFSLGPRLMVGQAALAETGLLQPGALVSFIYRLALPRGADAQAFALSVDRQFPDAGWRIRGLNDAGQSLRVWLDRLGLYLTLIGLAALLVGGVGVGNGVAAYMAGRARSIAILKCVGAPQALVFSLYLTQIMALSLIGIAIGLVLGAVLPWFAAKGLGDLLPVAARVDLYWRPMALAALFGLLVALLFALWPLLRARFVAPSLLMRGAVAHLPAPRWRDLWSLAIVALILIALVIATAAQKMVAAWFVIGTVGAFILFPLLGRLAMAIAAAISPPRGAALRLALANLHRPGAATVTVMLSLGLGLTVLVATALIEGNLQSQIQQRIPKDAPTLFFVDIQPDQVAEFERTVLAITGGGLERVPSLRGRIVKIAGVPVEQVNVAPDVRWAVDSDRGFTYAALPPEGSRVVAGRWWAADYRGPPLVSFDANLAKGFGIGLGDSITVNLLGREIEAKVANLRRIDWTTMNINFTFIFSPGTLENAPQTWIATVKAKGPQEEAVFRAVTERFANISVVRVADALDAAALMLGNIGLAARVVGAVSILAGLLVLAGAMLASQRRRVYDAVVMKVLGATAGRIAAIFAWEFAILGLLTAAAAVAIGALAAYLVIVEVMTLAWSFLPWVAAAAGLGAMVLTLAFGLAGTIGALRQRPMELLRND